VSRTVKPTDGARRQDGTLAALTADRAGARNICQKQFRDSDKESVMPKSKVAAFVVPLAALVVAGCQSPQQTLADEQGVAVQTAANRGRFEMNCPQATGMVLSQNLLQPVMWGGMERAEYTVGVEGCGQRRTYVVICQLGSPSCFAGQARY
jgi:hypothetical protein